MPFMNMVGYVGVHGLAESSEEFQPGACQMGN